MSPPTDDITIAVLGPDTAAWLDVLAEDVFDHPVQPALLQAFLANPANVLVVARTAGQVVGMATGITYLHPDKPLTLFINEVGVAAAYQGRGIGRALLERLLAWGQAQACVEAWVATGISNHAARGLYAAVGGVADPEAAVVYAYDLKQL